MVTQISTARDASQTERAVLGIRELVLRGEFRAGERLSEVELAARLSVSRTPIRAALQRLEEEGLLEAALPIGYMVRSFTEADIFDAIEVRGTIEGLAARTAAERGVSRSMLDEMRQCLKQIDHILAQENEWDEALFIEYGVSNAYFHTLLLDAADSPIIRRALSRVISLPFSSPNAFVLAQAKIPGSFDILKIAQAQHHDIVDAIEARSGSRAEALAREHARIARKNLELALLNTDALRQVVGAPLIRRV
ncbi:MAG: GntR family transcriptional regulator [Herbaspirillum sp.]|jgi:GntR family transcriptional regulator of vanillate catabolism|nr:GntR family transcriptional regulator [Herbaspirillum sp.]